MFNQGTLYGLLTEKGAKLHRLSFSRNVLEHIGSRYLGKPYQIMKLQWGIGKKLSPGELSSTGAYAIISSRNNHLLRASLCPNTAHLLGDGSDRYTAELALRRRT